MEGMDWDAITPEDAQYIISMLDRLRDVEIGSTIPTISIGELDLDALASSLAGITDPIGQIQSWFQDQLRALTSWFSSAVDSLFRSLYNTLIKPTLSAIAGGVDWIRSNLQSIASTVTSSLGQIATLVSNLGSSIASILSAIAQLPSAIWNQLQSVSSAIISSLSSAIASVVAKVSDALGGLRSWLSSALSNVISGIAGLASTISGAISQITGAISSAMDAVVKAITQIPGVVSALISRLQEWIGGAFAGLQKWVGERLEGILDALGRALATLSDALRGLQSWLAATLAGVVSGLRDLLSSSLSAIGNWIAEATKRLQDIGYVFQGFVNAILRVPEMLGSILANIFKPVVDFLGSIAQAILNFFADPVGTLRRAFEWLAKQIWDLLPSWLKDAIIALQNAWNSFVQGLQDFLRDPLGFIQRGFSWLAEQIWKLLPDWLKGAIVAIQNAWNTFVQGLQDFIKDPIGFIRARFEELAKWIWEHLPEPAKQLIEKIRDWILGAWDFLYKLFTKYLPEAIGWAWNELQRFIANPLNYIWEKLLGLWEWISKQLAGVWNVLRGAWDWFVGALRGAWDWLVSAVSAIPQVILTSLRVLGETVLNLAKSVGEALAGVFGAIVREVAKPFQPLVEVVGQYMMQVLGPLAPKERAPLFVDTMVRSGTALMVTSLYAAGIATIPLMLTKATKAGGHAVKSLLERIGIDLDGHLQLLMDVGLSGTKVGGRGGGGARFSISSKLVSALGEAINELGDAFDKYASSILQYAVLWTTEPLGSAIGRYSAYFIRDLIPVELPGLDQLVDFARRVKGVDKPEEYLKALNYYVSLYGYSTYFVEQVFGFTLNEEKIPVIEIRDRFYDVSRAVRKVPIALIYELPSASDVAAMMVRDIFYSYDDFIKLARARGMPEDIAALYYIYRFKYPSPEQLFEFYWRGVSGVLWYAPRQLMTDEERSTLLERLKVGAEPRPPAALNFDISTLSDMIGTYMKWHDLFPAAWEAGFTSDRAIVMDLAAEMPDKIDVRWMLRYAIFELLASKGITRETPVPQLRNVLEDAATNKEVLMDLSMVCRLLQARGLHPYFVPFIAVADTLAALADERTLVRSGFINLYERGALDVKTLDKLLSNLVVASFKVSYFDIERGTWVDNKYVNVPVAYLPAERKLIELRALLDKFERPWREVWSDLETAYREYILDASSAMMAATAVAKAINELLPEESKALVGTEYKLTVDEDYLKTLLKSWEVAREVYTIRRIRSWVYRVLGWLIYRVAYGYVRPSDLDSLASTLSEVARLPQAEREAIATITKAVWRIATREYIPTPSQLATIAEVVPAALKYVDDVLEALNVPEEWRPIWRSYITVKPIADEVRTLVSYYYRAKRYGVTLPDDVVKAVEALMSEVGYTDREKAILDLAAYIYNVTEEMRKEASEVIPSLSMLASMAEYIDVPLDYVAKVMAARRVERTYAELWLKYVSARTIASEVNRVSNTLRSLYEHFAVPDDVVKAVADLMKRGGWTSRELAIFQFDLELRRRYRILNTLVPTLRQFVTDALYLGEWERLLEDWLAARGIEAEKYKQQVEYYKKLIKSRKLNRRLSWFIARLMNAYCAGIITLDEARKRLEQFKDYGLDDDEIKILLAGFELERAYRQAVYGRGGGA